MHYCAFSNSHHSFNQQPHVSSVTDAHNNRRTISRSVMSSLTHTVPKYTTCPAHHNKAQAKRTLTFRTPEGIQLPDQCKVTNTLYFHRQQLGMATQYEYECCRQDLQSPNRQDQGPLKSKPCLGVLIALQTPPLACAQLPRLVLKTGLYRQAYVTT